jgi:ribosome biogenesis protein YTM1
VASDILVAAGGIDRAVHVYSIPSLSADIAASEGQTGREIYTLKGHTGTITSLTASSNGTEIVSGSYDGNIHLYTLPVEEPTEHQLPADPISYLPGQRKRQKRDRDREGPAAIEGFNDGDIGKEGWRRGPDMVLKGHKGMVAGVMWDKTDKQRIWSAGFDGSVRGWNLEVGSAEIVRVRLGHSSLSSSTAIESHYADYPSKVPLTRHCCVSPNGLPRH